MIPQPEPPDHGPDCHCTRCHLARVARIVDDLPDPDQPAGDDDEQ